MHNIVNIILCKLRHQCNNNQLLHCIGFYSRVFVLFLFLRGVCGTLKCENAAICEKVAKCEKYSTLNVKIDAICEKITLNVKK